MFCIFLLLGAFSILSSAVFCFTQLLFTFYFATRTRESSAAFGDLELTPLCIALSLFSIQFHQLHQADYTTSTHVGRAHFAPMDLQSLPADIFHLIIDRLLGTIGVWKCVKLRLVNSKYINLPRTPSNIF